MTFNDGNDIDRCRVMIGNPPHYPEGCPQNPPYGQSTSGGHGSLMSIAHESFQPFGLDISLWATTVSATLFVGAVVASTYRRAFGQLLTSRAMAPFVTKSVYDRTETSEPGSLGLAVKNTRD